MSEAETSPPSPDELLKGLEGRPPELPDPPVDYTPSPPRVGASALSSAARAKRASLLGWSILAASIVVAAFVVGTIVAKETLVDAPSGEPAPE